MLKDFLSSKYPAENATDGQYLYRSLGSFWTQIFQDKNALKGYTLAMAEEAIQAYYHLVEVVNQYSIKDIAPLHTEKWLPLVIKKSDFNQTPFVFEPGGALFGYQPASDTFYAGQLFKFGLPKETSGGKVFGYSPSTFKLADVGVIANRIIAPSLALIPGVDFVLKEETIYFKTNLFDNEYIPRAKLVGDFGAPLTFKTSSGAVVEDELIVLWLYMARTDEQALYKNFGTLLDINLPTSESYKTLLASLFNLFVEGPTITALNTVFAALLHVPVILETKEVVEDIYADSSYQYLVTDKHVYRLPLNQTIQYRIEEGLVMYAGEPITESVQIADTVIDSLWWQSEIHSSKLGFSSHVFAANTKNQLFFANTIELLTYTGTTTQKIVFPVSGRPEDVQSFQSYLNEPSRKAELLQIMGWSANKDYSQPINPVDFLFTNLFKNNTLLLKLLLQDQLQAELFFSMLPSIQPYLPPHVYLLTYLQFQLPEDELTNLNYLLTIDAFPGQTFSVDGSISLTGERPGDISDTDYYKDYINRLFCVSIGPYRDGQPLHADGSLKYSNVNNLDELQIDNTPLKGSLSAGVRDGLLRTEIPLQVKPPGELFWRTPSTREVPTILLIDF